MGAVFPGAPHAPLTTIGVDERTGDVWMVPPLAIACLVSAALSRGASERRICTIGLLEQGRGRLEAAVLSASYRSGGYSPVFRYSETTAANATTWKRTTTTIIAR